MIAVGERVPAHVSKHFGPEGPGDLDLAPKFAGRTVVMFGVPAAYSPTCSEQHVPGFIAKAAELKAAGVDEIICHSVNDPFVMRAWAKDQGTGADITMVADFDGSFARALGTDIQLDPPGLGLRSKRYLLIAKDGVVTHMAVEGSPGDHDLSTAEAALANL